MERLIVQCFWFCFLVACILSMGHPAVVRAERMTDGGEESTDERPNVLWIIAEDMSPDLGFNHTPQVKTPRIDALASVGMRYSNAFTTAPVCSASRSAFMTGMYQTSIGAHNHRSHRNDGFQLPQGVQLMSHRLMKAGYYTANLTTLVDSNKKSFFRGTGKTDWNFSVKKPVFDTSKFSELKSNQPFYAQINFSETHRGKAWNNAHKNIESPADPAQVSLPPYYPDHPEARDDWAQYLNTVMALDRKVGFVLDQLKKDGLAENTVVFFFADHGRAMMRGKQWCYDSGLRVPLLVYWPPELNAPAGYKPGTTNSQMVEAIDLTATTLDLAGVKKPPIMQGRILLGERADEKRQYAFGARDRCDETVFRIRTVRDSRYRYIRNYMPEKPFLQINRYKEVSYPMVLLMRELEMDGRLNAVQQKLMAEHRASEELYDLQNDPYEIDNLASAPKFETVRVRLSQALDRWIMDTNDQGHILESPETVKKWDDLAKKRNDARIKRLWDNRMKSRASRKSGSGDR